MTHLTDTFVMPLAAASAPADLSLLKNIALVVFFAIFVGIALRLMLAGRGALDRESRLPLDLDDETGTPAPDRDAPRGEGRHG